MRRCRRLRDGRWGRRYPTVTLWPVDQFLSQQLSQQRNPQRSQWRRSQWHNRRLMANRRQNRLPPATNSTLLRSRLINNQRSLLTSNPLNSQRNRLISNHRLNHRPNQRTNHLRKRSQRTNHRLLPNARNWFHPTNSQLNRHNQPTNNRRTNNLQPSLPSLRTNRRRLSLLTNSLDSRPLSQ